MWKIFTYSAVLIAGIAASQLFNLEDIQPLHFATLVCLSYIMIEVGLEFTIDKSHLSSYGYDYLVAATAATFPWIFCALYFYFVFDAGFKEALLIGRFAAPTSAGVLFAMLSAAGLAATWFFHKARILAIFDDLDTILLMIPLQIMVVGFKAEAFILIAIIALLLFIAYRFMHQIQLPTGEWWLLLYSFLIVMFCAFFEHTTAIDLEVLLPAFALGCMLYHPHDPRLHDYLEPEKRMGRILDIALKVLFMFLVGCSLPKIHLSDSYFSTAALHVLILTFLSNLGKMFPALCYREEASLRERLALSVAMFPRGEVGAGVLLVAIHYAIHPQAVQMAALSLTLNLLLTGAFIALAIWLVKNDGKKQSDGVNLGVR